jgi:poly-gamma-glutamate synthesis protein (capsule biosynthesis protein)
MKEIAHAAINAGADIVVGHGPHFPLPVEIYRGKPVYYGLGSFSFHAGHGGLKHGNWVGMLACIGLNNSQPDRIAFRFVRHKDTNETILTTAVDEHTALADMIERSAVFGTKITIEGDDAVCSADRPHSAVIPETNTTLKG